MFFMTAPVRKNTHTHPTTHARTSSTNNQQQQAKN